MSLLKIPLETRLQIYTELLVFDVPLKLNLEFRDRRDHDGTVRLDRTQWVHVAILRVNKGIHAEATQVLYSKNNFRFDNLLPREGWGLFPPIAAFLQQINTNARLLRHISVEFPVPSFNELGEDPPSFPKEYADALQCARTACPDLRTIEIVTDRKDWIASLSEVDIDELASISNILKALHESVFKDMESLENLKIVLLLLAHGTEKDTIAAGREALMGMMPSSKWILKSVHPSYMGFIEYLASIDRVPYYVLY